jgi:hypothetical protein
MDTEIVAEEKVTEQVVDTPVEPRLMSYDDLKKTLSEEPAHKEPVKEEPAKEPELKKEEVKEPVKEVIAEPAKVTQEEPKTEQPFENLLKELEATKQRLTDKDKFIQRQGNEIGELRKFAPPEEVARIKEAVKTEYDRIHYEQGPFAADEYKKQVEKQINEEMQSREVLSNIEKIQTTRQRIVEKLPTFETTIDDMADSLKEDGVPDNLIAAFKQNPYLVDYGELLNINKAAIARKQLSLKNQEVESLKVRIAELEKKPGELIDKINSANRTISGKSAGVSSPNGTVDLSNINPRTMSYKQLKEFEKSLSDKGG